MDFVFADSEVRARKSVTEVGSYVYAKDPATEPILWSVMPYKSPRALVFEFQSIWDVLRQLKDARLIKWTQKGSPLRVLHWSPFDVIVQREVDRRAGIEWPEDDGSVYGVPGPYNTVWVDLSELSLTTGLPIKLERAAAFVGSELKDPGKKLIELFCLPTEAGDFTEPGDAPVKWEQFRQYCAQDVQAMRPIFEQLCAAGVFMQEHIDRSWAARQMNARGVEVDVAAASYVLERLDSAQREAEAEIFDRYGFKTSQVQKLVEFLGTPNAQVETIEAALEADVFDEDQRFVAEARVGMAGAARKKLGPLARMADPVDHRVRGGFIYHGAWTGRFTSIGVQFQNFVREPIDEQFFADLWTMEGSALFERTRSNIRGFLRAKTDHTFVAGDFKAIELRVGAWLADEGWLLDLLAGGTDVYRAFAAERLQVPLRDVTEQERQFYKSIVLGCIYGLGSGGWIRQQAKKGVTYTKAEADDIVNGIFRSSHPAIVGAWKHVGKVFLRAIDAPLYSEVEAFGGKVTFTRYPNAIVATRPSGASQFYWMPTAVPGHWQDGTEKEDDDIQFAMKSDNGFMALERTYGARIYQGLVQGIAYDLMIEALVRAERWSLRPVMSIHDELVCEAPKCEADAWLGDLKIAMKYGRPWAETIPIEVSMWTSDRFTAK